MITPISLEELLFEVHILIILVGQVEVLHMSPLHLLEWGVVRIHSHLQGKAVDFSRDSFPIDLVLEGKREHTNSDAKSAEICLELVELKFSSTSNKLSYQHWLLFLFYLFIYFPSFFFFFFFFFFLFFFFCFFCCCCCCFVSK